jgi:hypothetical protein
MDFDTTCLNFYSYLYYHNKKLYLDIATSIDTTSDLLFDFNLNVNDTFNLYDGCTICGHSGYYPFPVDSIDSLFYGNKWRKRITFEYNASFNFGGSVRWVEGIGDIDHGAFISGLDFYGNVEYLYNFGGSLLLECFQEPSHIPFGTCYNGPCNTGIGEISGNNVSIYPNPSTGKFTINATGNISIYNLLGEKIFSQKLISEQNEIDLSSHPKGVYFAQIATEGRTVTKKIVIQ